MEEVKSVNFFNISKEKNESYQSFLTKLMAIWDESKYSDTSILKDKILDNVNNDDFRQQILAAKEFDVPKFLALCMSFDSLDVKEDEIKIAEGVKALEEKNSESFFLPFSEVVLNSMPVRFCNCSIWNKTN